MKNFFGKILRRKSRVEMFDGSYQSGGEKESRSVSRLIFRGSLVFFKLIIDLGILMCLAFATVFFYAYYHTVNATELTKRKVSETTIIYDRTGDHVLYRLYGEENRKLVSHDDLPDALRNATIAIEDERFYKHVGIDVIGILRALRKNYEEGGAVEGASTITQQVARNALLTREKTIVRKFKEAVLAIKIERTYTKEEILDLYLNLVPYGSNTYGAEVAARTYFNKAAIDLSLDEASVIAAIPKATTTYSPYSGNDDLLRARQEAILRKMGELGMYGNDEINVALQQDTLKKVEPFVEEIDAPHFVFYVREELEKLYDKEALERGGLKVYTTLDYDMQKRAEKMVSGYAAQLPQHGASNAALIAVRPETGAVEAMVGSIDYFDRENDGNVNVGLQLRQPGSSFKPIVYAAAFEKGYQPETLLYDVTTSFGPDGTGKEYKPDNFDGRKHGLVTMRKALQGSLNIPAVKTQYLVGKDETIDFAQKLGYTTFEQRNRFGLSLVLGGGEVKLLEHVGAFASFANDGVRAPVHGITRVVSPTGEEVSLVPEPERVMSDQTARKINSILTDNKEREYVFGRTNVLSFPERSVAAKTGTTQSNRDALLLGYTKSLAVGVWAGNNDATFMKEGALGSTVAGPLWREFMETEIADTPDEPFAEYEVVESDLKMVTGKRPPRDGKVRYIKISSGKEITERKADKSYGFNPEIVRTEHTGNTHTLLYYINKDEPLDDQKRPDFEDEMLWRWERSLGHFNRSIPNWKAPEIDQDAGDDLIQVEDSAVESDREAGIQLEFGDDLIPQSE